MVDLKGSPLFGVHSLRHFFASVMIEQNHLPKRVQEMLGHSSLQMTYDRYGHLFAAGEDERAKMEKASEFLIATKTGLNLRPMNKINLSLRRITSSRN